MNRRKKKITETDRELLYLSNDIDKLKTKVKQLKNATAMMDDEAFKSMCQVEKSNLPVVIKGNGLKRKSEQSKTNLELKRKKLSK